MRLFVYRTGVDSQGAVCAYRKISSKGCGEKIQPQINANERKSIQEKSTEDKPTSRPVIGCVFEVGKVLGSGSLESM